MFGHRVTLFRLMGFAVRVDLSWLFLAVLITWSLAEGYFPQALPGLAPGAYWAMGLAGLVGLAFSIIVHEFAHSLVARRFSMPINGITLFIFGGVAEMEEEPSSPKGEFLMAIAGPLTSLAVALGFWGVVLGLEAALGDPAQPGLHPAAAVAGYLAFINVILAVFNMVPAFPMDGGRVLRSILWGWRGDILWATRIAAQAGSVFGMVLIALALVSLLWGNVVGAVWWFLIGLFVRMAAASATQRQVAQTVFSARPVRHFMRHRPIAVHPDLPLNRLVEEYFFHHYFKDFPVTSDGRLQGVVSLEAVKRIEDGRRRWTTVSAVMEPVGADNAIDADEDAGKALGMMQRLGKTRLLVTERERLVGVLALRDLMNYLELRQSLSESGGLKKAS
ncbi:site-2 protease family protein [Telmatospirillum sp. J64-1]|uniref:site-2 protease family protein n=1 Tax=Telmatospirillum sp. J64-1 TaxID=2502183 RepID=UPI00115C5954|nr:site-2 protease family protein [Telmatospirillum sp. J64-1]